MFSVVMLSGIYGLLSASFFVSLDAVDVAFTEAAVGAGISPILMLATLTMLGKKPPSTLRNAAFAVPLVLVTGALLILGTLDMPAFGSLDAPAQTHVAPRYMEDSYGEIGVPNLVTAVLASYRGFDTFGEVVVIFTAGISVLTLLLVAKGAPARPVRPSANMKNNKILRIVGKVLIAPIMLFGLYVQFHGDYSPGGGFQAGVIFAAGIILYEMLFGLDVAEAAIKSGALRVCTALGVLIYGCVGLISFLSGRNYLDYDGLAGDPISGQHYGILLVELGVGITVASTMLIIYFAFARRVSSSAPPDADDDLGQPAGTKE
jgi:multicomponent Na+:H+ antiporter subunit B